MEWVTSGIFSLVGTLTTHVRSYVMTWHARWQAMVDFYQTYRQGVFTTGKYDEAGAVLPKAPPLHLIHYRYQLVNHYAPVTADQVRHPA